MSDRNFRRDAGEVDVLADLLEAVASTGPLRVLTTTSPCTLLPPRLAAAIRRAEQTTDDRPGMTVCLGIG